MELPLTGFGGDYLFHYSNQSAEVWLADDSYWLNKIAEWRPKGMHTSRMAFCFPDQKISSDSTLDYAKFDRVLEIFDLINVKIIADLHNNGVVANAAYGVSAKAKANWLEFASHYLGDTRLAAIQIFNEPRDLNSQGITDLAQTTFYANLTRAIHAVDPNRLVIFPYPWLYYTGGGAVEAWLSDLQKTGMLSEPNVVFDVLHPYFFENDWDMGMTPEEKAEWNDSVFLGPCVQALGAGRCWMGETFFWTAKTVATVNVPSHVPTDALQDRFQVAIINVCVNRGVGFDLLSTWDSVAKWEKGTASLSKSNYVGGYVPPPVFTCVVCGALFGSEGELADHVLSVHPVVVPAKACIVATVLTPNSRFLPFMRVFRDRFVPYKVQELYYNFSKWLLRGLVRGDERVW